MVFPFQTCDRFGCVARKQPTGRSRQLIDRVLEEGLMFHLVWVYLRIFELSNILSCMQETLRTYKSSIFRALSHPTRIAILEVLRDKELSARTIQEKLGVEQANLSQHLAILRSHQIVVNRKDGNQVFYSIRNPMLVEVLDIMRRYFHANLTDAIQMLGEVEREASTR